MLAAIALGKAQSNGVTFLSNVNQPYGLSPDQTSFSSCWGWTSPDGHEYAFLSTYTGMAIYDMSFDPPEEIHFVPGPASRFCYREIKTFKHYGYIVYDSPTMGEYTGIQIIDLAHLPDSVGLIKTFLYPNPPAATNVSISHSVTLADGYLYCNGSTRWSPGGTVIFDLHPDPTTPTFVGTYEPAYIHDSYVHNNILYGAAILKSQGGGLFVADISDKSNPVQIGKITYDGSGTHNVWVTPDGRYAFTTDEIGTTTHNMKVWDLDSLPKSVKVAEWGVNPLSSIHNVYGRGNYIYVAYYKEGMRVVDIHDPTMPVEVGFYDSYTPTPDPIGSPYAGCWGVYPYFPSGKWIGSDMQTGLYVFTFDGLKPRSRPRLLEPADSSVLSSLRFAWTSAADKSEDPHSYEVHISGMGFDTTIASLDTSIDLSGIGLPDGTFRWYVTTHDEYSDVNSLDTLCFTYVRPVGVDERRHTPARYSLLQNFPNPFNPLTTILFSLAEPMTVTLKLYSILGIEVATMLDRVSLQAGRQHLVFDAGGLPSGSYFYRMVTPTYVETKRMVLQK